MVARIKVKELQDILNVQDPDAQVYLNDNDMGVEKDNLVFEVIKLSETEKLQKQIDVLKSKINELELEINKLKLRTGYIPYNPQPYRPYPITIAPHRPFIYPSRTIDPQYTTTKIRIISNE